MKAVVFKGVESGTEVQDADYPIITNEGEVIAKLKYAALNRRDYYITKGLYPNLSANTILGSDGIVEIDSKKYLINPNVNWGESEKFQGKNYSILGMPSNGTFAEALCIPKDRLTEKPRHLSDEQAAGLPLAGLTAYRALFSRARVTKNDRVFISGFGGGVASFAFLFAKALGCEVIVSSGSKEKRTRAMELGALGAYDYKEKDFSKRLLKEHGAIDVVIDSAGGKGFSDLLNICEMGARIAIYGGTKGKMEISPQKLFWKQISILGSTMGSDHDFNEMVSFVNKNKIIPIIDKIYPLNDWSDALGRLADGKQLGKVILQIED